MAVAPSITEKLAAAFTPEHLQILNESHNHNVAPGSETHFKAKHTPFAPAVHAPCSALFRPP